MAVKPIKCSSLETNQTRKSTQLGQPNTEKGTVRESKKWNKDSSIPPEDDGMGKKQAIHNDQNSNHRTTFPVIDSNRWEDAKQQRWWDDQNFYSAWHEVCKTEMQFICIYVGL